MTNRPSKIATHALLHAVLVVGLAACERAQASLEPPTAATNAVAEPAPAAKEAPRVPREPGKFSPLLTRIAEGEHYDVDLHTETQICSTCHADIVEQWKDSPHAFASLANPFFRVAFDQFVEDAGPQKAIFCGGCHDPSLTFDGSIQREVEPRDRRAHVGVTCAHCHGVVAATSDGNASHTLSTAPIPLPKPGDPHSLAKHMARVGKPVLRTNELCVSCHKNFLTPATGHDVFIGGINDTTPFRRSVFSGNVVSRVDEEVEPQNCVSCHMPPTGPKNQASHRFIGGHTTLAATIGSREQLDAIEGLLRDAATLSVAAMGVGDVVVQPPPAALEPGEKFWADVVVFNENTGHSFPGGARDLRDTWIEVRLLDANGELLASAGTEHAESGTDESAVQLRAVLASDAGDIVDSHRVMTFRAPVIDRTVAPRDALVARYTWTVPKGAKPKMPLELHAKLRHRRVHRPLHDQACAASKTERGLAFAKYTKRYLDRSVDPCVAQPVIELEQAWARFGANQRSDAEQPAWERHFHRGLGLMHNVLETLPEALDAFQTALDAVPADAAPIARAQILFQMGNVAARQGRTEDAMDLWSKTEALIGAHPAIHFARGNAHQRVFGNAEATKWFQKAAELVDDDRVWRQLAISAGSAGKPMVAYEAARAGLLLEQRDPDLLRSQALALRKLESPQAWRDAAMEAFAAYKRDEDAPNVRDRCSTDNPFCLEEREPMRVVELQ